MFSEKGEGLIPKRIGRKLSFLLHMARTIPTSQSHQKTKSTLHVIPSSSPTLWSGYYCSHFAEEATKAQTGKGTCPRWHRLVAKADFSQRAGWLTMAGPTSLKKYTRDNRRGPSHHSLNESYCHCTFHLGTQQATACRQNFKGRGPRFAHMQTGGNGTLRGALGSS